MSRTDDETRAERAGDLLRESEARLGDAERARLDRARAAALAAIPRPRSGFALGLPVAAAASVLALVAGLVLLSPSAERPPSAGELEWLADEAPPGFYEDLELVLWLDATDA